LAVHLVFHTALKKESENVRSGEEGARHLALLFLFFVLFQKVAGNVSKMNRCTSYLTNEIVVVVKLQKDKFFQHIY
jgi:hypothetical protein